MRNLFENILSNVVATVIIAIWGILSALLAKWFKPDIFPIVIAPMVIFFCFIVFYKIRIFGTTRFNWGYFHSYEKHTMILRQGNKGIEFQEVRTVKNIFFKSDGKIKTSVSVKGDYCWDDIVVTSIDPDFANVSEKQFTAIDSEGNERKIDSKTDGFAATHADYEVKFDDKKPADFHVQIEFNYDSNIMKPEYYIDVCRPIRKIVLELEVQNGVRLKDVCKQISTEYGDAINEYGYVSKEDCPSKKKKDDSSVTVYRYVIRNPKLFYRYKLAWEWL
ncbi:MAG: hypothetical protein IKL21_01950 [Clostridia bacterium]|nr:hypothetical protein [Clostridia bacterium]